VFDTVDILYVFLLYITYSPFFCVYIYGVDGTMPLQIPTANSPSGIMQSCGSGDARVDNVVVDSGSGGDDSVCSGGDDGDGESDGDGDDLDSNERVDDENA
jgi:hypothetical protein